MTGKYLTPEKWNGKIANAAQVGGIETSVLDNGTAKGSRIAWINTGSGLRFKVVIDRCMDIAEAFYNEYSLAWLHPAGITTPQPFSQRGIDWLYSFGGGLMTTCGLSHIGGPEEDEYGERGLHGRVSNIPAEIQSIQQPQVRQGKLEMSITGLVRETRIFGPSLDLKRTISASVGAPALQIHDEVINNGNEPAPHMLLYHCNFGWPLVDEGTDIIWKGDWKAREGDNTKIFVNGNHFKTCPAPLESHKGGGEEAAFINVAADENGNSVAGLYNRSLGLAFVLRFSKKQLPWLINWQHWGPNEYVTGLEPATNPPIGQAKARKQKELIILEPGEGRTYDLAMEVLTNQEDIIRLLS